MLYQLSYSRLGERLEKTFPRDLEATLPILRDERSLVVPAQQWLLDPVACFSLRARETLSSLSAAILVSSRRKLRRGRVRKPNNSMASWSSGLILWSTVRDPEIISQSRPFASESFSFFFIIKEVICTILGERFDNTHYYSKYDSCPI